MNWKLAGVVMLSAMLAGCELPEEKPKKPPEPRAATPEGRARQDIQAALGDDDGTTTASYDPDTRVYSVRWMIGSNLTDNMTRRGARWTSTRS